MGSVYNNATGFRSFVPYPGTSTFTRGPRFGHISDFAAAFEGKEEAKDYVVGLIFAGAIMASLFFLWSLFLVILKCMGQPRAGFLSGAQFRVTQPKRVEAASILEDEPEKPPSDDEPDSACDRPTRLRFVFLTSGLVFVLFTILMVTQGLTNLQSTVDTADYSAAQVERLATDASEILDLGLREVGEVAIELRTVLNEELQRNNLCPANPQVQDNDMAQEVVQHADSAQQLLQALEDFSVDDVASIEATIERIRKGAVQAQEETEKISFNDWRVILVLTVYMVVPAILMAGCLLAFFEVPVPWLQCLLAYFFTPLFILMVLFAWIVASGIVIAAGANGDFCLPGGEQNNPDTTILQILAVNGYDAETNPLVFSVVNFYISQCTSDDPFAFVNQYLELLEQGRDGVAQLDAAVQTQGVVEELSLYCGRDFSKFISVLENMKQVLAILSQASVDTLDLISCERIVPIYTNTVYDGTCTYSISAMLWCFSCTLILAFFGMLMLTFRSAYKPTIYEEEKEAEEGDDDRILDAKVTRESDDEVDGSFNSDMDDVYTSDGIEVTNTEPTDDNGLYAARLE